MTRAEYDSIENHFKSHMNTVAAQKMEKYMKGRFEYLGIRAPRRKELLKNIFVGYKWTRSELLGFCEFAWNSQYREMQYCATDYLASQAKKLTPEDLPYLETLVTRKSWWDTVDSLAVHPIGKILRRDFQLRTQWVDTWSASQNIWLKRTAILHQLKYKEDVDKDILRLTILRANGSNEFFLNKAIGWVLREYSRTNPEFVQSFCDQTELSNLSRREALRLIT